MVGEQSGHRSSVSPCMLCISSYSTLLLQLGLDTSQADLSTSSGDPGPTDLHAESSDLGPCEDEQLSDDDIRLPSPEPAPPLILLRQG